MGFDDYKVVPYRNQPDGWVAETPSIPGRFALMPSRDGALEEYQERHQALPADTTEIVHA